MKKIFLCAFAALYGILLLSFTAYGQSSIFYVPTQNGDTTIVREWQEGYYVTYNRTPHCFSLHNPGNNIILTIPVSDPNALVRDFRILDDSIFVGGSYVTTTDKRGFLACFSIQDFYNGYGDFKGCYYQQTTMFDNWNAHGGYCENLVTNIRRLALFRDEHGIRVAFIADNVILDDGIVAYKRVGIGSAQWNGPALTWGTTPLLYNKDGIEEFTDIITTDNYVVAVSRTNDSALLNIRTFNKSLYLSPSVSTYRQCMNDLNVIDRVMTTPINGDKFAVVYHYKDLGEVGVAVKEFSIDPFGWISFVQGTNIPLSGSNFPLWEMRDVRYLPNKNYIAALQYVYAPFSGGLENIVHRYDRSNLYSYFGSYLSGYKLHALDKLDNDKIIASGRHTGYLNLFTEHPNTIQSCGSPDVSYGNIVPGVKIYTYQMPGNMNYPTPPFHDEKIIQNTEYKYMNCSHYREQENTEKP